MNPDDQKLVAAVLDALEATWDREGVAADQKGDRIFVRWIDRDPEDPGWDDWKLVAIIPLGGTLKWLRCKVIAPEAIKAGIDSRMGSGKTRYDTLTVWWCRSTLDGPPGVRVTDWAKPTN